MTDTFFWTVAILGIYLLCILVIGFYSSRGAGETAESFFVANRQLNWLQESMSVFTTLAPAGALLGTIGLFYRDNAAMLGYIVAQTFMMPLTYWYVGSRLRRLGRTHGYQTQAAFVGDFYKSPYLRWAVALTGICFAIPIFMTNPVAVGYLLNQFTGISYQSGVLLFIVVAAVYTLTGGLRAVANTDVFHGVLLLIFILGTIVALVANAGGLLHVLDTPRVAVPTSGSGLLLFFAWIPYQGLATMCQPDRSFRMFATRDDRNLRRGVIISGAMIGVTAFGFFLIALSVHNIAPDIQKTDTTLATGLQVAAAWLIPWFVMNAWGGGMSTFTGGLISAANIFIKDIIERGERRASDAARERKIILWARVFIIVCVCATVGVSFYPPIFIWTLINLYVGSVIQFAPMIILGFLWRGVSRRGAEVGFTCGLACMILWSFFLPSPFGVFPGLNALIVNIVVLVVVSLFTQDGTEDQKKRDELRVLAEKFEMPASAA
jgi:Na+/proline symporter